jgi:hypothetical protein
VGTGNLEIEPFELNVLEIVVLYRAFEIMSEEIAFKLNAPAAIHKSAPSFAMVRLLG